MTQDKDTILLSVLRGQVQVVAVARDKVAHLKKQRDILLEKWNNDNRGLLDDLTQAGADVAVDEATLRELTLQAYQETGNKTPVEGVGIREMTKIEYDPKEALKWAMQHQIALSLDKKTFEGFAKTTPLDFVSITKEPQATIAVNLVVKEAKNDYENGHRTATC